jgi:hypothetical protein
VIGRAGRLWCGPAKQHDDEYKQMQFVQIMGPYVVGGRRRVSDPGWAVNGVVMVSLINPSPPLSGGEG